MTTRPLLILPSATQAVERTRMGSGTTKVAGPSRDRQGERLGPSFEALRDAASQLTTTTVGALPELVVVFEVRGEIKGFRRAVERVLELAWLAEQLAEDAPADEDFAVEDKPDKGLTTRLYFVSGTQRGVAEMLRLWGLHQAGAKAPENLGRWFKLFDRLADVRRWSRDDRLVHSGALEVFVDEVMARAESVVAEVELWFQPTAARRRAAEQDLVDALAATGAEVVQGPALVEFAGLHQALVRLPAAVVVALDADPNHPLGEVAAVRQFRVAAQALAQPPEPVGSMAVPPGPLPEGAPIVAILDGLPLANHVALAGRIQVDDPEGLAESIPVDLRRHGTAICSATLWGDLSAPDAPPRRPLYVRPILQPAQQLYGWTEVSPPDQLFTDVLHAAIARLFEGENPAAPNIAVVNLSVGDPTAVFSGFDVSALARLLDALAWRYELLFIVSSGNWWWELLDCDNATPAELEEPDLRHRAVLQTLHSRRAQRRLISPAESSNALTIGALDADLGLQGVPPHHFSVWAATQEAAPAVYSRSGPGLRLSPKPELVTMGGRQPARVGPSNVIAQLQAYQGSRVGLALAAPGAGLDAPEAGQTFVRGTSYAAAIATHAAARISDALDELAHTYTDLFERAPRAVWIKTLLVHGASRRGLEPFVEPLVDPSADTAAQGRQRRALLDGLVGFGTLDLERSLECTTRRVTVLAGGWLGQDEAHEYRLPLPPSLLRHRSRFRRRLYATLSWISPPRPSAGRYRTAALTLDSLTTPGLRFGDGSERGDARRVGAGTVVHLVQHGRGVARFTDGDTLRLKVNARGDAAERFDETIPYVVAVTLDVDIPIAPGIDVDIYQDVRTRIAVPVAVPVGVGDG